MERVSYRDLKITKNIKNGAWEHLLMSLKILETLAMVAYEFQLDKGEEWLIFAFFFPFYYIKMPNDQNALKPFL